MGVLSDDNIKFLDELKFSPHKLAAVVTGDNGKIYFKCNFCNKHIDKPRDLSNHLMYECEVAGLFGNPGKKQIGGKRKGNLRKVASEKYELSVNPRLFSNDELERKAFEMVGFYRKEGANREELINILHDFARRNRQYIRKRQLEMYLRNIIQMMEMQEMNGISDPRIASLIQRVHQLESYLQQCMSRIDSAQSNIAFAQARSNDIQPMQQKIRKECEQLRQDIAQLTSTKSVIESNLQRCESELRGLKSTAVAGLNPVTGLSPVAGLNPRTSISSASTRASYESIAPSSEIQKLGSILEKHTQEIAELSSRINSLEAQLSRTDPNGLDASMLRKSISSNKERRSSLERTAGELQETIGSLRETQAANESTDQAQKETLSMKGQELQRKIKELEESRHLVQSLTGQKDNLNFLIKLENMKKLLIV
jgi:chromosome segregation ATPase